jgi:hypothetical protein
LSRRAVAASAALALLLSRADARAAPPGAPSPWATSDLAVTASAGAALDNPAFVGAVGGRYRLRSWLVGADVEWNPWASLLSRDVRPGVLNVYATGIKRWDMKAESVKLRTTAHLGASVLLFDLYGAPMGSVGPYLGLSLLSVEVRLAPGVYLLLDPAQVAIPVPQLDGAPLTYRQYRATLGAQLGG